MVCPFTGLLLLFNKRNELLIYLTTWMNFKIILLSKIRKTKECILCDCTFNKIQTNLQWQKAGIIKRHKEDLGGVIDMFMIVITISQACTCQNV